MKSMKNFWLSIAALVLTCGAFQAQAQGVYWLYNGQRLTPNAAVTVSPGKNLNARRLSDGTLTSSFSTPINNGQSILLSQGHYTTSTTNLNDQVYMVANPGRGLTSTHSIYHASGTVYQNAFSFWNASFQSGTFNRVPGRDIVVWTSASAHGVDGGWVGGNQDNLYLLGDKPGLVVDVQHLGPYQYRIATSTYYSWAYQIKVVNIGGRDAFDVYFSGPNPYRAFEYGYRPQGILRVNFNTGARIWIQ